MSEAPADMSIDAETLRTLWEEAQWTYLAKVQIKDIASLEARADLALLLAAAQFHLGDKLATKTMVRQAVDWGASHRDVMDMLFAGVENSLGRVALFLERSETAKRHFGNSVAPLYVGASAEKTAFVRQFHEMMSCGLLPEGAKALSERAAQPGIRETASKSWETIFDSKIAVINHELSLALQKQQLSQGARSQDPGDDLEAYARKHSVSQLGQDVWILEQTAFKRDGFFVEFGATNGILLSNSYLLETAFGWRGICAEPNPEFFEQLQRNRRCTLSSDCIADETGKTVQFIAADVYGGLAEYAEQDNHADKRRAYAESGSMLELTTISLHDFLIKHDAPRTIDYLSIDTEGSEYGILSTFPFEEWDIRHITVEHNFTPMREKIFDLLQARGYVRQEAQFDDWYRLEV